MNQLNRVFSYFSPVSNRFSAWRDFCQKLTHEQQALTLLLAFLASLITLPFLGFGGVAVFRWTVKNIVDSKRECQKQAQKVKFSKKVIELSDEGVKKKALEIREILTKKFLEGKKQSKEEQTHAPYFNQIVNDLRKDYSWPVIEKIAELIFVEFFDCKADQLTEKEKAFLTYRFQAEVDSTKAIATFKKLQRFSLKHIKILNAIGDGNCFFWACLAALNAQKKGDPFTTKGEVKALRRSLVKTFLNKVNNVNNAEFRQRVLLYLKSEEAFSDLNPEDEDELTEKLIDGYVKKLSQDGTWNGNFEAEILAESLERPIVIFAGDLKNLSYRTVCGYQYYPSKAPIFLRFNHNHYDALLIGGI